MNVVLSKLMHGQLILAVHVALVAKLIPAAAGSFIG